MTWTRHDDAWTEWLEAFIPAPDQLWVRGPLGETPFLDAREDFVRRQEAAEARGADAELLDVARVVLELADALLTTRRAMEAQ